MKKRITFFLLGLFVVLVSSLHAEDELRLLTFNIRMSFGEVGKPTEWRHRKDMVASIIKDGKYDFVGIQEAIITATPNLNQEADLKQLLPDYGIINHSRTTSPTEGESTPILYLKARWEPDEKEQGYFWLSDTPNVPASITWKNACPRIVVWARFHELQNGKRTGRAVYFINTHFDHVSELARRLSAIQLSYFIDERQGQDDPVFLTGDLNCGEDSTAIRFLKGETVEVETKTYVPPVTMEDTFRTACPNAKDVGTFHGYSEKTYPSKIDYIFGLEDTTVKSARIIRKEINGLRPSDHWPVDAVIELK